MIHKETKNTPYVNLSAEEGLLEIKGNSYAERMMPLYEEIFEWIDKEVPKLNTDLHCVFHFIIFNSISIKNILLILSKLNIHYHNGTKISIDWFYDKEDEDNMETAEDLTDFIDIPIKIIAV